MKKLIFSLSLLSFNLFANGRSPAVEDFVGVEPEGYVPAQKGAEVLFNFSQNLTETSQSIMDQNLMIFGVVALFILLPVGVWIGISQTMKNKTADSDHSNVHQLNDYRNRRSTDQNNDDDIKKAS